MQSTPVGSPENYAFVMNIGELLGDQAQTLAPGHKLRRATSDEQKTIKEALGRVIAGEPILHRIFLGRSLAT